VSKLKALSNKNTVTLVFGEWFDKTYGNTYYDVLVLIDDLEFTIASQYGYNAGDRQSIDNALAECGYRVRVNNENRWRPYDQLNIRHSQKLKRELYK